MSNQSFDQALTGIRVLEVADEKGMYCGKLLADMGAEVIKIEKPGGDSTRHYAPFAHDEADPNKSVFFWFYNTNKKSITLNLESHEGQEFYRKLLKTADVFIETMPPGYMHSIGLGYEDIQSQNQGLVFASVTDFGQTGPRSNSKGSDLVTSALGGSIYINGRPEGKPVKIAGQQAYNMASHFAAIGIMAALLNREVTHRGQYIDVSIQECVASAIEHTNVYYIYSRSIPTRQSTYHWSLGFHVCECKDGDILLTHWITWPDLISWLEEENAAGELKDEKWISADLRREPNVDGSSQVFSILKPWAKNHTVAELVAKGQSLGFSWVPVNNLADMVSDPHYVAREWFVEVKHPELGTTFKYPGSPYMFHGSPWKINRRAPIIGEHNKAIYTGELGLSEKDLCVLFTSGVI